LLEESSSFSIASYYRCSVCGSVWTYPKGKELTAPPRMVTIESDKNSGNE